MIIFTTHFSGALDLANDVVIIRDAVGSKSSLNFQCIKSGICHTVLGAFFYTTNFQILGTFPLLFQILRQLRWFSTQYPSKKEGKPCWDFRSSATRCSRTAKRSPKTCRRHRPRDFFARQKPCCQTYMLENWKIYLKKYYVRPIEKKFSYINFQMIFYKN